jgi:O-antigen ligase
MAAATEILASRRWLGPAAIAALSIPCAAWIGRAPLHHALLAGAAVALFAAVVIRIEVGLVVLVASMLLSPEIPIGAGGGAGLETSRSVVLRTEELILLVVGLAWLARLAIHKDLGPVRRTRLNAFIAAYAGCCLLSTLLGMAGGRVRPLVGVCYVAKTLEYFFIFFITVNYVRTPERFRRLLLAVLVTAAAIIAYAWWQVPQGTRPSAPFEGTAGEPNTLGGYLVLMFAVAAALALALPSSRARWAAGLLALAILPPLAATLSRSSWLALLAALLVLLACGPGRTRLLAGIAVGAAVLLLAMPRRLEERVAYTFTSEERSTAPAGRLHLDPSSSARLESWSTALAGWRRHPIAGWGITGYGFLDAQYFRVLVETGLLGFAAFVALLAACGSQFWQARRALAAPLPRGLATGMLAGLAGLLAHAVGTNTFILVRIMEPYWLLTGLVVASLTMPWEPAMPRQT